MATINLSIPDKTKRFVEEMAAKRGCASLSEFFRMIIRDLEEREQRENALVRQRQQEAIQNMLAMAASLPLAKTSEPFSNRNHDLALYR